MYADLIEVDRIIRWYRDDLNHLDERLTPLLPQVSPNAKRFILEFIEAWDAAIIDKGLLSDYSKTAEILQEILDRFLKEYDYPSLVLYSDIKHFLDVQQQEKDNDWYKSKAEDVIFNDIGVLHFCYSNWKETEMSDD